MDLTNSFSNTPNLGTGIGDRSPSLSEELLAGRTVSNRNSNSLGGLSEETIEYGDPSDDADYWQYQDGDYSCGVVAQICVYESLTGERITEADASDFAADQGWFDPASGTYYKDSGNLLEDWGIQVSSGYDNSVADLANALEAGDKPIVGLDGNEIWYPEYDRRGNSIEQEDAGHLVWVTGINYEPNGSVDIILNDSGDPNGSASVVGYDDFINAWDDTGFFAAIAQNPLV